MVVLDLLGLVSGDLARGLLYSLRLWVVCLSSVFEPGCCLVGIGLVCVVDLVGGLCLNGGFAWGWLGA